MSTFNVKKIRPCLRCDRKFMTTPETRICTRCKKVQETFEWRQRQLAQNPERIVSIKRVE